MERARRWSVVAACLACVCVPAGCDLYDDVALYDAPWAYWRLVPPSHANESDVIADSSGRCDSQRPGARISRRTLPVLSRTLNTFHLHALREVGTPYIALAH